MRMLECTRARPSPYGEIGRRAHEMKDQKGMDVKILANRAISGIEAAKPEIRPGLSNVLKAMSRVAPQLMLRQMAKMAKPRTAVRPPTNRR